MRTPTKNTPIGTSILTPSCNITPTRETARDGAYDEFASLTQNGSEAPRDGTETAAMGVGVLCGAVVYYFHDDGLEVQVPTRVAHHVELALTHAKLALSS